jgi:hypothetical protein
MTRARKGDLVIVEQTRHDYIIGQGSQERTTFDVAVVASATRDGAVKTYRGVGWGDELLSSNSVPARHSRCYVASAADVDLDATLAAAKAHHWEGHPGQPKSFDSLADVRAIVVRS